MGIKGLESISLLVEDWPMAVEFYRDLLGLPVEQVAELEQWVTFAVGGARLAIYGGGVGSPYPKGADRNAFVPNLECDDIEATIAEIEARGVPIIVPLSDGGDGYKRATLVDPEGNRLQLVEWIETGS